MTTERYNHRKSEKTNFTKATDFTPHTNGKPYYCLEMFPYPSGKIHMGHIRNYSLGDVLARMKHAQGYNVLHPMGWDSFGLPAENAAKEKNIHPQSWTLDNIAHMKNQLKQLGLMLDWSKEVTTCLPDYYGQQQKIFLHFLKHNIAYKKEALVNWDPVDQTVLANEQVIDGCGWRSGVPVEKKKLNQWFLRISDFAKDLLDGVATLNEWPERVRSMQEKWIGQSIGAEFSLEIFKDKEKISSIDIFTTRPETILGMAYVALAYDHKLVEEFCNEDKMLQEFCQKCQKEAMDLEKENLPKAGYALPLQAKNLVTGEFVPVYVANYVLSDYGTGAVFGCPAHDARDFEFANGYNIPFKTVILSEENANDELPYLEKQGILVNSGSYNGMTIQEMKDTLKKQNFIKEKITYRLRDWGVSRQRYWGCPIPVIYCDKCGCVPVPENDLPVKLPEDVDFSGNGNPLDNHPSWKHVNCPECGAKATRETDTLDTFFDSSWYFMRYLEPQGKDFINPKLVEEFLPVNQYIGGIEHAVLHLLYARFITRALAETGVISVKEPFKALFTQGMVCHATFKSADGRWLEPAEVHKKDNIWIETSTGKEATCGASIKMSKSKKNTIDPQEIIERFGADTARLFVLSDSPPEKDIEWTDAGIEAAYRFIQRIWTVMTQNQFYQNKLISNDDKNKIHLLLKDYHKFLEELAYNKAIAKIYELFNVIGQLQKNEVGLDKELTLQIIIYLNPLIPFMMNEIFELYGFEGSLTMQKWPDFSNVQEEKSKAVIAVQVLGKLRGTVEVPIDSPQDAIENSIKSEGFYKKYIEGQNVKKIIFIKNKILNYVI